MGLDGNSNVGNGKMENITEKSICVYPYEILSIGNSLRNIHMYEQNITISNGLKLNERRMVPFLPFTIPSPIPRRPTISVCHWNFQFRIFGKNNY